MIIKKNVLVFLFLIISHYIIFAGENVNFKGIIAVLENGNKGILGDDHGILKFVSVYGDCDVFYTGSDGNENNLGIPLYNLPVGLNVEFNGGITGVISDTDDMHFYLMSDECCINIITATYKFSISQKDGRELLDSHISYQLDSIYNEIPDVFYSKYYSLVDTLNKNGNQCVLIPQISANIIDLDYSIDSEAFFFGENKAARIITYNSDLNQELVIIDTGLDYKIQNQIILPKHYNLENFTIVLSFEGDIVYAVIRGWHSFYIYDMKNNILSYKICPVFENVEAADSQSGGLTNLWLSENGLILKGKAQDYGYFTFNMEIPSKPVQEF